MKNALLLLALLLVSAVCVADDRVDKEMTRLEETLKAAEAGQVPDDVEELFGAHRAALERAKKATSPEYRLYRLRDAFIGIETLAFLATHYKTAETLDKVNTLWLEHKPRFAAKAAPGRGTLLQRALIESASTRADRLYHASMPYAKASAPWSGLYYLGEAEGNLRFREFVQSLAGKSAEKSPGKAQVAAMLESLERDTLTFFAGDIANQSVVPVSVRLKEARELLDAGRIDGAALLLVEARAALSRRGGPKGAYAATNPKGSVVSVLEAWAADEQPPMSDALRGEVVPFYGALFGAAPARRETKSAQVTVTLVRWPYT
jgi:hypothetical protein